MSLTTIYAKNWVTPIGRTVAWVSPATLTGKWTIKSEWVNCGGMRILSPRPTV